MTQVKGNNALKGDDKPVLSILEGGKKNEQPTNTTTSEALRVPTMDELKHRATVIHLLSEKHSKLTEKRQRLDKFEISHDKENACINVTDANGEEFESHSPKSIAQLIEFWKTEFDGAISEIELQLKQQFIA